MKTMTMRVEHLFQSSNPKVTRS